MIEYLTELVKELQKQGYGWVLPIEVERDFVRVIEGMFRQRTYYISRKDEVFEISLHIEGKPSEITTVERETIEQVVDYIME